MEGIEVRVRYCDVDKMNVVYYGKYFDYIEWSRTELLRQTGLTNKELEEKGIGLPIISVSGNYKSPARYDDVLIVKSYLKKKPEGLRLTLSYEIKNKKTAELIFEGESTHVCVDMKTMRPIRFPVEIQNLIK